MKKKKGKREEGGAAEHKLRRSKGNKSRMRSRKKSLRRRWRRKRRRSRERKRRRLGRKFRKRSMRMCGDFLVVVTLS